MVLTVLSARETPHLGVAQRQTLTRPHCDDQWRAITSVAALSCRQNSTSHRVLKSARDVGPAPRHDRSRPRGALGSGAATSPYSPGECQAPFFEFFHNCRRT